MSDSKAPAPTDAPSGGSPVAALEAALAAHQAGRIDEAEEGYRAILEADPDQSDALNFLGILLHQRGRTRDGIAEIERSVALNPGHAAAHLNLGTLLAAADEPRKAVQAYKRACELAPEDPSGFRNLGLLLEQHGRFAEAIPAFERVVSLRPDDGDSRKRLAESLYYSQRKDDAVVAAREWLAREPGNPLAGYILAAYSQVDVPARASDECMRAVFDECAPYFEKRLAEIEYSTPGLIGQALRAHLGAAGRERRALDAGCGTGLCGPLIRPYAAHLAGVDLSPEMLERARARRIYDDLATAELTAYLAAGPPRFDLAVCADTLIYFGDLHAVLAGFARSMRPGAFLVLSVEALESLDEEGEVRLMGSGRYAHTLDHVRHALDAAGLALASHTGGVLRMELGRGVDGHVVVARRGR